ncbi:MAG TPA: PD-(D/E)XK nuclease family protein [Polyangiales bacterium]|nr:PD-(D/E)XK nuclease family protein [Polyangiales bacterium]
MRAIWSLQHWAQALAELPTTGRLPQRVALVPNSRVAHALRRELIETGHSSTLIGTRFMTLLQLASEVLLEAGEPHLPNDRELGPWFALDAFSKTELERFERLDLCRLPGWDVAFTRTIAELDAAMLSPEACLDSDDPHVRDVGRMHQRLREHANLITMGALFRRAAALTASRAGGPSTLAVLTGFESPAELSLLRALPAVTTAAWAVRPKRATLTTRFASLVGAHAPELDARAQLVAPPVSALQHLQLRLFEDMQSTPAPRDASVTIALYAGVHEEVEAAASWVTQQILEHGVAARDIAILSSIAEPYGALLRARLDAISPEAEPAIATFSERGVPLVERADGTRVLLLLRALCHGLSREKLAMLLPFMRPADAERRVRGQAHAWEILNAVASVGGTQSHLDAGSAWPEAWRSAVDRLAPTPLIEAGMEQREIQHRAEMHGLISSLSEAIEALAGILAAVIAEEPLHLLWARIQDFVQAHLKLPFSAPPAAAVLEQACNRFRGHEGHEPAGVAALRWLDDNLCHLTVQDVRFGHAAVYLGTLGGVRGLRFRAVRIIGLAEGTVPSASREDPVLPDTAREWLSPFLLGSRHRAHRQLTAFDDAVRCASERLCLTAPRTSVEGSVRQPAAVLLDVVKALEGSNVDLEKKLEHAAADGRARERLARNQNAVSYSAQLARMALGDMSAAQATTDPSLSLDALRAIRDRAQPSVQDGLLFGALPFSKIPGLGPDRPISASRLETLVSCPHEFLYEHILGFREAEGPLRAHALELMTFGTWLHSIAEEFWQQNGPALATRAGDLAQWNTQLRAFAVARFETLQHTYPFENERVAHFERETLCDQLEKLLALDWNSNTQQMQKFVAVERRFGYSGECDIATEAGPLYLRGKIDKLDTVDNTLLIRDIKTGGGKPRADDDKPDPGIDLQVAVYALVAKRMARDWGTPDDVEVAYIYLRSGDPDRSWRGADYADLEGEAKNWLAMARETLETGTFARSPIDDDCKYCAYKPVCASERKGAKAVLADPRVPERLKRFKLREDL